MAKTANISAICWKIEFCSFLFLSFFSILQRLIPSIFRKRRQIVAFSIRCDWNTDFILVYQTDFCLMSKSSFPDRNCHICFFKYLRQIMLIRIKFCDLLWFFWTIVCSYNFHNPISTWFILTPLLIRFLLGMYFKPYIAIIFWSGIYSIFQNPKRLFSDIIDFLAKHNCRLPLKNTGLSF